MGFVTLKDGTVIHESLLSPLNVKDGEYKMSVIGFTDTENEIIKQREELDKELKNCLYNSFQVVI